MSNDRGRTGSKDWRLRAHRQAFVRDLCFGVLDCRPYRNAIPCFLPFMALIPAQIGCSNLARLPWRDSYSSADINGDCKGGVTAQPNNPTASRDRSMVVKGGSV
jgi:hypothetical protein